MDVSETDAVPQDTPDDEAAPDAPPLRARLEALLLVVDQPTAEEVLAAAAGSTPGELDAELRAQLESYRPRSVKYFRGAVVEERLGFLDKLKIKLAKGQYGDFRDWKAIEAYASSLANHGAS